MTRDEIEAERARFVSACPEFPQTKMAVFGDPQFMFSHTRDAERAWMKRAEIARAEQAELRERVRELAKTLLREFLDGMVGDVWQRVNALPEDDSGPVLRLAEEAGVWFDDDGNEWPLDNWRERM